MPPRRSSPDALPGPPRFPDPLPRGKKLWRPKGSGWTEQTTDGLEACDLISATIRLTKGPQRGELVRLRWWQGDLICDMLRLDADGRRVYQCYEVWVARKNSKSLIGSGLAIDGLFDEEGAEVYSAAGDKDQAKIVFKEVRTAVELDPELSTILKCYRDAIEYPATGSVYRALSSDAGLKEGLNSSRVIFDELHVQPDDELWNVMNQGSDTRQHPLVVSLSTFGKMHNRHGAPSLGYTEYERCKRVMSGEEDDPTFGCRVYETPDPDCDHRNPKNWKAANPALGDFLHTRNMAATCRRTPEADFRTKRMNIWTAGGETWLPFGSWADLKTGPKPEQDTRCVLAFDGSYGDDSTALVGCTIPTDDQPPLIWVEGLWERPPDADENWRVPRAEIRGAVHAAMARYDVVELAPDPPKWETDIEEWEDLYGEVVVRFPTWVRKRMAPACNRFYAAVMEHQLRHDGDLDLARHLLNCVTKHTPEGVVIVKAAKSSPRKIDAAVAAVVAHDRACWHAANPDGPTALDGSLMA